jgi:intracellular septation protein
MKDFFAAAKYLVLDMASTLFFLALFFLTHNTWLAVSLGVALGVAQIGLQLIRGKQVATMEWLSLFLIVAAGGTTLYTNDPRFVLIKPSVFYAIVGVVMLKPGWLNRYLPDIVKRITPDVATAVGYYWAALMFVSAAVNAYVALTRSLVEWAMFMPIYGIVSKLIVFSTGFLAIRVMTRRRVRALPEAEREALLVSTGYQALSTGGAVSPATGTTS